MKLNLDINGQQASIDAEEAVELTQAEYDALPSSKLTDGKAYYIKDADASGLKYEDITSKITQNISNLANLKVVKYGKLVEICFRYDYAHSTDAVVLSNLPPTAMPNIVSEATLSGAGNGWGISMSTTYSGQLRFIGAQTANKASNYHLMYITTD